MRSVRRENTSPELVVRRAIHGAGLRYRLHGRDLPGTPDLILTARATVIFVHGCFWHGHDCRHGSVRSKSNTEYWHRKIEDNRARDLRKTVALRALGWYVEVIWECQVHDRRRLAALCKRLSAR